LILSFSLFSFLFFKEGTAKREIGVFLRLSKLKMMKNFTPVGKIYSRLDGMTLSSTQQEVLILNMIGKFLFDTYLNLNLKYLRHT
jgi:hypothetical protein